MRSRTSTPPRTEPALLLPADPEYRRAMVALFSAGVGVFLLLYVTQGLLPQLASGLQVSPVVASLTISATTAGVALGLIPMSSLSEIVGRVPVMTGSIVTASVIGVVLPLCPDAWWLIGLRGVQGLALAGLPATAMAYLADRIDPRHITAAIGIYLSGNSIGGLGSRFVSGLVAEWAGWRVALGVLGVLSMLCAVVFRTLIPGEGPRRSDPLTPRELVGTLGRHLRNPLLLRIYLLGALFMVVFGAVYTVLGFRLEASPFGLSEGAVGAFFLIYLVGTMTSPRVGKVAGSIGVDRTLMIGAVLAAIGTVVTVADSLAAIAVGLIIVTAGFFTGHVVASASASASVTTARAQASALYLTVYYVANSVGATVATATFHGHGWNGVVVLCVACTVAAGLVATTLPRHIRPETRGA
ncbi:MFS transporter [Williamsia sp. MIQD14]|uniref:MFS transporter n=1 Tax=Williamsia sp. MIQD14 TaxID=3425703 RepID=UPI003DA06DC2